MKEYSQRLGRITPEQFQAALTRLNLGDFIKAEPISFGLFGQNVFLTSTRGEFVLRGAPHYPWQFPTERFIVTQLFKRTKAPVPYPYLLEETSDIFGWSFIIMPKMPGIQLQDKDIASQLSAHDRIEIALALAEMLVEVQNLSWEHDGKYDVETKSVKPFGKHYREWVVDCIREKVAAAQSYNKHTTKSDIAWIESVIAEAMPVLHFTYEPCVVLADYGEHNTVVRHTKDKWCVSGIFDLMTAHFGDGQADLSLQVTTYLNENEALADAFVTEYLRLKPKQFGFVEHQKLYMLDLMLSFWRHWQRNEGGIPGEDKSVSFKQWARPSVEYWNKY